jgi:tetratricopeptide (TPR) repeat protein
MRPLVVALSIAAMALASGAGHQLLAQEEIFEQGNQLYLEGDYAGAVEAYQSVLDAGFESVALHYNLGNAHFKTGELGLSILAWERARALAPNDPDVLANLELAFSQTADAIEPLPRFWLISVASWWVGLLPRGALIALVAAAWLIVGAGVAVRVLARRDEVRGAGTWAALGGASVVLLFGTNLFVRELGIGAAERGVILADAVPVRSAPADQDDLTLFEIHEGTRVRVDERAGEWAEVVLDDGKVGWVPADVMEVI